MGSPPPAQNSGSPMRAQVPVTDAAAGCHHAPIRPHRDDGVGGVLILIATGSTSYKNAAAKRALRNYRSLSEKDGRVLVAMATLDKPATDGASVRYLLQLKASNIPSLDLASVTITLVVTEQECDAACAAIAATGHAIAFDSEYVPVRGAAAAGVGAARKSALVQLCSSKDHVYIFEVMVSQFFACFFLSLFLSCFGSRLSDLARLAPPGPQMGWRVLRVVRRHYE